MRFSFLSVVFSLCLMAGVPAFAQEAPPVIAPVAAEKAEVKEAVKAAPSAEAVAQGKALLAATVKAHGGEAFLAVKSLKATGKGTARAPEEAGGMEIPLDSLTLYLVAPDKARLEMETGFGLVTAGRSGGNKPGWVVMGGQVQNDPNDNGVGLIPVTVLVQAVKENYPVAALPVGPDDKPLLTADGKKLIGFVLTDAKGRDIRMYVEEGTNILRRAERTLPSGIATLEMSGYKTVSGASLPGSVQVKQGGKPALALTLNVFEVNPKLDDALFERPKSEGAK